MSGSPGCGLPWHSASSAGTGRGTVFSGPTLLGDGVLLRPGPVRVGRVRGPQRGLEGASRGFCAVCERRRRAAPAVRLGQGDGVACQLYAARDGCPQVGQRTHHQVNLRGVCDGANRNIAPDRSASPCPDPDPGGPRGPRRRHHPPPTEGNGGCGQEGVGPASYQAVSATKSSVRRSGIMCPPTAANSIEDSECAPCSLPGFWRLS